MDANLKYTRTAIALHWLVALLIILGWSIGLSAADLPASPVKLRWLNIHKWIGVTVLMLVLVRSGWRLSHAAPELPEKMPPWQQIAAHVSHSLLYALMLVIPVTGWLMSSAKGYQTVWLGLVPIPDVLHKDLPLGVFLEEIHALLAFTLAGVVAVHTAAALRHHFVEKDDVLRRMLPMLAVVALLMGAVADARVSASDSRITATFRQQGVAVEVPFHEFDGSVAFDAKNPAACSAKLDVQTASLDLGDAEYNEEARKPQWFDSAKFPTATFRSSRVVATGSNRYTASGTLTLKGRATPLDVTFTAQPGGGRTVYAGEFPLSRKAFAIGDKGWDGTLEDKVLVRFRILTINH